MKFLDSSGQKSTGRTTLLGLGVFDLIGLSWEEVITLGAKLFHSEIICIFNIMQPKVFEREFLNKLEMLSTQQQEMVLSYIKTLIQGNQSQQLLKFAGKLDVNAVEELNRAIEGGCETVDKNDW